MTILRKVRYFVARHWKKICLIVLAVALACAAIVAVNYSVIGRYKKFIYTPQTIPSSDSHVAVVFGGGVENGKPRPLLQDRLDAAATLLETGKVRKLIVSGDNRFPNYNEPRVMKEYLVDEKSVDPEKIQLDNAGRSTYETCERVRKVFDLQTAILVSESTHLPRAIYTCRSFGVEAYGYASDGQSSAGLKIGQRFREILARTKASLNIYTLGEKTVLGDKIIL